MREQSKNYPQTFHMGLVEPLIIISGSIFGIVLAVGWLLDQPAQSEIYMPILLLVFCMLFLLKGLLTPRKLDILEKDIIVSYLAWKRTISAGVVKSYTLDQGRAGRGGTRYFVTIQLNKGGKISFTDIKEGNETLLEALEKWTEFKPIVDVEDEIDDEELGDLPGKDQEFRPPEPLSELTEQLVQKMFLPDEQMEVRQLLINKCGNNIYAHEKLDKYGLEPLRFSALRLSKGNLKKLHHHVQEGNDDFRNLLYGSGFSGEEGEATQKKWVQSVLGKS